MDNTPTMNLSDNDLSEILEENGFPANVENSEDNSEENSENNTNRVAQAREELEQAIEDEVSNSPQPVEAHTAPINSKTIPTNSPTLLVDESTIRFSGAEWFKEIQKARVIIAGIGGIGSNVAFQLARMNLANITMYDEDTVELLNMAGQLYSCEDVGNTKVNAMANMISLYTNMSNINAISSKFTSETQPGDIMICGFDNMKARRIFFNSWLSHLSSKTDSERTKCLYLDGRLSMDTLQILCIKGDDSYNQERYQKEFLFTDAEAEQTICSRKQTTYLACMIGSLMVNLFTNFIANTLNPVIPYSLPFFTEYDAPNMLFNTEE